MRSFSSSLMKGGAQLANARCPFPDHKESETASVYASIQRLFPILCAPTFAQKTSLCFHTGTQKIGSIFDGFFISWLL